MSEPAAGLVLGHSVWVAKAGGQAHRGKVTSLSPDVTIWLNRVRWSDAFREGDHVRIVNVSVGEGLAGGEAMVVEASHGVLRLTLLGWL